MNVEIDMQLSANGNRVERFFGASAAIEVQYFCKQWQLISELANNNGEILVGWQVIELFSRDYLINFHYLYETLYWLNEHQ